MLAKTILCQLSYLFSPLFPSILLPSVQEGHHLQGQLGILREQGKGLRLAWFPLDVTCIAQVVDHGTLLTVPWPGLIMGPHCGIGSPVSPDAKEKRGITSDTNKQAWGCSFTVEGASVYEALGSMQFYARHDKNK